MRDAFFESVLRAIWDNSTDGVIVANKEGEVVLANEAIAHLLGWAPGALVGESVDVLVPEESRFEHKTFRAQYAESPYPRHMGGERLLSALRKDGSKLPADISLTPVRFEDDVFTVAVIRDATARHRYEEDLREVSFQDALTGLYNRGFLNEELDRLERGRTRPIAVIAADLDGLKLINDEQGHQAGDEAIQGVADVLRQTLRTEDIVARTGGDEFIAILPCVDSEVVDKVVKRVRDHALLAGLEVSIGAAICGPGELLQDTVRAADAEMYRVKKAKKS